MKSNTKFGEDCKAGNKNYDRKLERNTHQGNFIQAILMYVMSVFRFPTRLCQEVTSITTIVLIKKRTCIIKLIFG